MSSSRFFLEACILILTFCSSLVKSQYYNPNGTIVPYPYQTALGLPPGQGLNMMPGLQPIGRTFPYPYGGNNLVPMTPNASQNYYAMLAQQGRPAYQYPLGFSQPGMGYYQPAFGYPPTYGAGYPPQGYGYPQPYGYSYPGMGYPYQDSVQRAAYPIAGQTIGQQRQYGGGGEIIDVSPEYQRQALGWPSQDASGGSYGANSGDYVAAGGTNQDSQNIEPRYNVETDSQTSNFTNISSNLTKPIITTKRFTTSIRRTFVYDSSKPGETKSVNLHYINGEPVTTTEPPTTTENEDVEAPGVTPKGRRFMDVPSSCPKGTELAHNGKCMTPFTFVKLITKNETLESTTRAPDQDSNEI